jgi:hypothetical protein
MESTKAGRNAASASSMSGIRDVIQLAIANVEGRGSGQLVQITMTLSVSELVGKNLLVARR